MLSAEMGKQMLRKNQRFQIKNQDFCHNESLIKIDFRQNELR